jgi:dGTPase
MDSIRLRLEATEDALLAPLACRAASATRRRREKPSAVRTAFQRDRDRIIHTKSFRRLMHKTQVFIAPSGDHYRTRLTHTLEVAQISRTVGRALRLNEDLIEAITMGHDLGHTPFGHSGEVALNRFLPGFRHNEQSLRIVDFLEKDGAGLNLTDGVRDGILKHSKPDDEISGAVSGKAGSLEGEVVRLCDAIAYMNHDFDDAVRGGLLSETSLPLEVVERLGQSHSGRINAMVTDIIQSSNMEEAPGVIGLSDEVKSAANSMRRFLFESVYVPMNRQPDTERAQSVVEGLCNYYVERIELLPIDYRRPDRNDSPQRMVADFIASMTDRYAVERFKQIYVPQFWSL